MTGRSTFPNACAGRHVNLIVTVLDQVTQFVTHVTVGCGQTLLDHEHLAVLRHVVLNAHRVVRHAAVRWRRSPPRDQDRRAARAHHFQILGSSRHWFKLGKREKRENFSNEMKLTYEYVNFLIYKFTFTIFIRLTRDGRTEGSVSGSIDGRYLDAVVLIGLQAVQDGITYVANPFGVHPEGFRTVKFERRSGLLLTTHRFVEKAESLKEAVVMFTGRGRPGHLDRIRRQSYTVDVQRRCGWSCGNKNVSLQLQSFAQ